MDITATSRTIRIDSGEAFFEVAKDSQRPFVVHAADTAITAIGTQFNVRRAAGQVVVAVAEGVVQVDPLASAPTSRSTQALAMTLPQTTEPAMRLIAGEQLSVAHDGRKTLQHRSGQSAG